AIAATLGAKLLTRNTEALRDTAVGLGQIDVDEHLQIAAWLRAVPLRPAAEEVAEQVPEQVEDRLGVIEIRHAHAFQAGVAVTVIALPLGRVAQHLVGLGRLLELGLGLGVADVPVGVILHGQLAVGPLDLLVVGLPRDAEDLVIIPLGGHTPLPRNAYRI